MSPLCGAGVVLVLVLVRRRAVCCAYVRTYPFQGKPPLCPRRWRRPVPGPRLAHNANGVGTIP
ncbi:hypothetical protein GCM10010246_08640 [Streptomyces cuspidosporus]|uniref:Secreted protein n=1 Tax=Streptomyces cuspidosporus TaxID=66882 RepID=A0ABN3FEZ5_9ACTN